MTIDEKNQLIHEEYFKQCWHVKNWQGIRWRCVKCKMGDDDVLVPNNPNYFIPEGFFKIWESMDAQDNTWGFMQDGYYEGTEVDYRESNPNSLASKLAEWLLVEKKKKEEI